jgi:four helix bundle protein
MEDEARQLSERLLEYATDIVKLTMKLGSSIIEKHITDQLFRSGTSAGANYEEACGAQSEADFIYKLQIVLKELRESSYWLRLIKKAGLLSDNRVDVLIEETQHLVNIIAQSLITEKKK